MRKLFFTLFMGVLCLGVQAQNVSLTFDDVTLSEALMAIDKASADKHIQFIYDELEDYRVSVTLNDVTIDQAVREVVGYHPMRMIFTQTAIFVETARKSETKLMGRLVDENGAAVEYANIVLYKAEDHAFITGGVSNGKGDFTIPVEQQMVWMEATSIGYDTLSVRTDIRDLGQLTMRTNTQLIGEVTVHGKRVRQKQGSEYVVVPDSAEAERAGRTLNLLDDLKLPGLKVDRGLGGIQIDGGQPILQINGKEVPLSRLSNLNPLFIKRIEYSNNPGLRYLDRGASGIINIILKERNDGGSVTAYGQMNTGKPSFVNTYVSGSYHKGKSEVAVEYSANIRDYKDVPFQIEKEYIAPERRVKQEVTSNMPLYYIMETLGSQYTYQQNDSTAFIASVNVTHMNRFNGMTGQLFQRDNGGEMQYETSRRTHDAAMNPSLDLFYSRKLKNRQKIELNLVGEYSSSKYLYKYRYIADSQDDTYITNVENQGYALSGEGVYTKWLGKVESRWGVQYQRNYARNNYLVYDQVTKMTKDNTYIFGEIKSNLGEKAYFSLGSGLKIFAVDDKTDQKTFFSNMSALQLGYKLNDSWSLTYSLSYQPQLPSLSLLSTVVQRTDNVEANTGNADLKPSHDFQNRLLVRYTGKKGFYAHVTPYYSHLADAFYSKIDYDKGLNLFVLQPINSDYQSRWGFDFEVGLQNLWKHVNIAVDGGWKQERFKGEGFLYKNRNFTSNLNLNTYWGDLVAGLAFTLTPDWSIVGDYLQRQEMQQVIYASYHHKKFTFELTWLCPFNSHGFKYESIGLNVEQHPSHNVNWVKQNGNMITVGVTYQLDFGKAYKKAQKTLQNGGYDNGMVK